MAKKTSLPKVWVLPASEDWICDQLTDDWYTHNPDVSTTDFLEADLIWLLSDWCWKQLPWKLKKPSARVITSVHHIVPEKFGSAERADFYKRDSLTTRYHVYNQRTLDFVKSLTNKPVCLLHYWANQHRWQKTTTKNLAREKYNIPKDSFVVSSFQRDTEGSDLASPKLEKGPDLLADYIIELHKKRQDVHVLLAGWRRQYIISRLNDARVPFSYIERPPTETINELYQATDLYPVAARFEGGPQALIECGLLGVPVVSRHVGIAEQVLPESSINDDLTRAIASVPDVNMWKIPNGMKPYRRLFEET